MSANSAALGTCAFGRAIDAWGRPLDDGPLLAGRRVDLRLALPPPVERVPIAAPFWTGVRSIDGLLTIGRGARVGIFGSAGTGKSMLIESVVAGCSADAIVVALVGERGREAQRWIASRDGRTTIVCATSDRPAGERIAATRLALAHAGALRARGLNVLVVLDSLARAAAALREIAIGAGESCGRGGYPPSVFSELARMLEVAGAFRIGSITMVVTVLSDGDDRDPVSDAARSLLDGHIQLSPRLANAGRFPAIDVPASTSRVMSLVASPVQIEAAIRLRQAFALLDRIDDARRLGIEIVDAHVKRVVAAESNLENFAHQENGSSHWQGTLAALLDAAAQLDAPNGPRTTR